MRIIKVLLIALLVILPFGELLRINIGNNIFLKPLDIVGVLLLFCTTVLYLVRKPFRKSLKWYFFLFPIVGLISLGINSFWLRPNELFVSFLYLLRWVGYMSVYFALIQINQGFKKKIITSLVIDGFLLVLFGYLQFFFYSSLRNLFYLGWDDHLYRMFSTFLDPNFIGVFFVLYFLFLVGLLFNDIKNRKKVIFYGILASFTLLAIFLTYSRSALIMLIISCIVFFIVLQRKKFILLLLGILITLIIIASPYFYLENVDLFRIHSTFARIDSISRAVQIIHDHPFIGIGFDSYRYAQIRYHFIEPISPEPSNSTFGPDTSLLLVFATTGIIGLLAYSYLWFTLLKKAKDRFKSNHFALVFFASSIGLFVSSLFNNSLFYPEIMLWMWLIAGLMLDEN